MHYKNGREAKVGDKVVGVDNFGTPVAGILVSANGNSTTCNGNIVPFSAPTWCVTIGDLLHVDDFPKKAEPTPAAEDSAPKDAA